jgi:hypothetical protein
MGWWVRDCVGEMDYVRDGWGMGGGDGGDGLVGGDRDLGGYCRFFGLPRDVLMGEGLQVSTVGE